MKERPCCGQTAFTFPAAESGPSSQRAAGRDAASSPRATPNPKKVARESEMKGDEGREPADVDLRRDDVDSAGPPPPPYESDEPGELVCRKSTTYRYISGPLEGQIVGSQRALSRRQKEGKLTRILSPQVSGCLHPSCDDEACAGTPSQKRKEGPLTLDYVCTCCAQEKLNVPCNEVWGLREQKRLLCPECAAGLKARDGAVSEQVAAVEQGLSRDAAQASPDRGLSPPKPHPVKVETPCCVCARVVGRGHFGLIFDSRTPFEPMGSQWGPLGPVRVLRFHSPPFLLLFFRLSYTSPQSWATRTMRAWISKG